MNRAELIVALAAAEAAASTFRDALGQDARHELEANGSAATWRMPGVTVSTSVTHDSVSVHDETAWVKWMKDRHPTEIETVERVRTAFQSSYLKAVANRGDPPCAKDGEVIPGLTFHPGGAYKSVSMSVDAATKDRLASVAREMVTGARPLALPALEVDDAEQT